MARKQKKKAQKGDEMSGVVHSLQFNEGEDPVLIALVNENVRLKGEKSARPVMRRFFKKALETDNARLREKQLKLKTA